MISDDVDFILFDVMINESYLSHDNVEDIADHLWIETVPVITTGPLANAINLVEYGFSSRIGTQTAEGLVMRPLVELKTQTGQRIITKIKYKDFNRQETK